MYPFWEPIIAPLVKMSGGRRVVEVGALRGETTVRMLNDLGPDSEVHVIDPVPAFDPGEHEARFPGRYVFHRDLSLNVLGDLDAFDVALIDGDHNWYSVYNEMRLLAESSRRAGKPIPLSILHDVGWPYGRRDLYYDPSNVPEEHQQPYDYRGMRPGRPKLLAGGGMNVTLANAIEEGGPRNGVMTGLEDFLAEHDRPTRTVVIPIYFGLAIVAETEMLDANPELSAFLDRIESPEGTVELLELSESIRLDAVVFEHNVERMRRDRLGRAIDRHLNLLRASLDAPDAALDALHDGATALLNDAQRPGDIVHGGSEAGLRYLAGLLDAHEVTDRRIWAAGDHLTSAAADLGDHVEVLASAVEAPVAMLSVSDADNERQLRSILGDVAADTEVVTAN